MANKPKPFTSPRGIVTWACINKPSTKFKEKGEYSLDLALPADVAAPLQAEFKTAAEAAKKAALEKETDAKKRAVLSKYELHVPGTDELGDDGNPTGRVIFKFKQTAIITPKDKKKEPFEVKIGMFDAANKPIPSTVIVGKGSEVKAAYEVIPFVMAGTKKVGVQLRLRAVQVLKLVKYVPGGGSASDYGFEQDADGYSGEGEGDGSETPDGTEAPATEGTGDGSEF